MAQSNLDRRKTNYQRRSAAYELVKLMATKRGYMEHERDGDGFDNFIKTETANVEAQSMYTVTNDEYSNEPVTGTMEELQAQFDAIGWDVKLEEDVDGNLYDANRDDYPTVAEKRD